MTDRTLEQRLRAWYADAVPEGEPAPAALRDRLAMIPSAAPVPLRTLRSRRGFPILAAAALLLAGGAMAAGSALIRLTTVQPPTPSDALLVSPAPSAPDGTPPPTAVPTAVARSGELIAFMRTVERGTSCAAFQRPCQVARVWIATSDGSTVRELIPDGVTGQSLMAWTPDGSRVLYADDGRLFLADPTGGQPQPVDTGCAPPSTSTPSSCQVDTQVAFSRDGRKIVFVRESTDAEGYAGPAAIATMDLVTGRVTELLSTSPAGGLEPAWSPDGTRIVYWGFGTKDDGGPIPPVPDRVFVGAADGGNWRIVSPPDLDAREAEWSPDGARILFLSPAGSGGPSGVGDLYTIRPDGTDLRRLTTDGLATSASWTPEGRILFGRRSDGASEPGWWTMGREGDDPVLLVSSSALGLPTEGLEMSRPALQPIGGPALASTTWTPLPPVAVGPPAPTPSPTPLPDLAPGFSWTGSATIDEDGPLGVTTTLLADGRVLVTEGCGTAAELYDPSTGTFTPTGQMTVTRGGDTATLLPDGRVLFAGGYNCGRAGEDGIWASAELYDPATGTFSPTGSMRTPREFHTATLLPDDRVLIAGGLSGSEPPAAGGAVLASVRTVATDQVLASAELYDPATGTFSRTGSMADGHMHHTATSLRGGRVLIVGGGGESSRGTAVAEVFDPSTGTFRRTGSLSSIRRLHTATLLQDGRVLVAGGRSPNDTVYRSAELYDPRTGRFSDTDPMTDRRQQHTATVLPDGRVLIAGGFSSNDGRWRILSEVELFDPATGAFTAIGSMGTPRSGHTATLLLDGRVLLVGGSDATGGVTSAVLYQP